MSSIKTRIAQIEKEYDEEVEIWQKADLPPPGEIWRLGANEFMTHVHLMALDKFVRKLYSDEEVDLEIKTIFLREMREARKLATEARRDALRQNIVDGINPTI